MGHVNTAVNCMMAGPMGYVNTAVNCMMDGPMEGSQVRQPTLRWANQTGSRYLHYTEVGMKVEYKKITVYIKGPLDRVSKRLHQACHVFL